MMVGRRKTTRTTVMFVVMINGGAVRLVLKEAAKKQKTIRIMLSDSVNGYKC